MGREEKGFTLIELLIVVAIIAILAAVAIPNFLNARSRAELSGVKSDLKNISTALETYMADNDMYPASLAGLETEYMQSVPTQPDGTTLYDFCSGATGFSVDTGAEVYGPDGVAVSVANSSGVVEAAGASPCNPAADTY